MQEKAGMRHARRSHQDQQGALRESTLQLRVAPRQCGLDVAARRYRSGASDGKLNSYGGAGVGKKQDPKFQPRLFCVEPRIHQVPLPLLLIELRFHNVGVGHFTGDLALLRERSDSGRLVAALCATAMRRSDVAEE